MQDHFQTLVKLRIRSRELLKGLDKEQLLEVPPGFRNNILWNIGHALITQQNLTYGLSGHKPRVPLDLVERYRKGTGPQQVQAADIETIEKLLLETAFTLQKDYESGHFTVFKSHRTSLDVELGTIEAAIGFNNIHEALHYGYARAQMRALAPGV
ncbi:MAG: DinB family protein [Planctomycetota bacterium]